MTPRTATLIGLTAILMWSLLAVMTVATGTIPAFQLAAMTFAIGALVGSLTWIGRPEAIRALAQPPLAWIVGVGGLFGYHALYFLALRFAPPAEAGLLNYLWPLLIVLFSSLLPGERLAPHHIIGALLGLAGTVLLFAGNRSGGFTPGQLPGLVAAFVAAFVWADLFGDVAPAQIGADGCGRGILFRQPRCSRQSCMRLVEVTVWPETLLQWLAVAGLGIGPVGAAFYAWDIGMKRGDIRVLGAASYATPLLSTAFLILAGFAKPSANIALAAVLIAGGGLIAAKDMFRKRAKGRGIAAMSDSIGGPFAFALPRFRTTGQQGSQSFGANSKPANSNPGATVHPTSVQSPVVSAALPGMRRHDRLRPLAALEIGPEPHRVRRAAVIGDPQAQRAAGVIVPDLHRVDAMPMRAVAARQQKIDRGGAGATLGVARGNRERSRDNSRLRDAASVRGAR